MLPVSDRDKGERVKKSEIIKGAASYMEAPSLEAPKLAVQCARDEGFHLNL